MAHPGDNINPLVVIGGLVGLVTILSFLIVWMAGPIDSPPDDGVVSSKNIWRVLICGQVIEVHKLDLEVIDETR